MARVFYIEKARETREKRKLSMLVVERGAKMERTQKMLRILAIFMVVLASNVEAGRKLKDTKEIVDQPQNYQGGFGSSGGFIPTPNGPVYAFGPSVFCSNPGVGCVRVPGGVIGTPPSGTGIIGSPPSGTGVIGSPPTGTGVIGSPPTGTGVIGSPP